MSRTRAGRDGPLRILAVCGMAGPVVFALLVAVASFYYPGYSQMTQAVSELGGAGAPNPAIQNANFFLIGVLVVAFAFGLQRGIGDGRGSKLGPVFIGVFGVSSGLANAFLPCDRGCEFQTIVGTMHNVTGLAGFLAAIAGLFLISRRFDHDPFWRSHRPYTLLTAVVALVSLLAWIGIAKAAEIGSLNGVLQRVFIAVWLVWVEVTAVRLFWVSGRSLAPSAAGRPYEGRGGVP